MPTDNNTNLAKTSNYRFQNKNAVAFAADVFFHSHNNSYP